MPQPRFTRLSVAGILLMGLFPNISNTITRKAIQHCQFKVLDPLALNAPGMIQKCIDISM